VFISEAALVSAELLVSVVVAVLVVSVVVAGAVVVAAPFAALFWLAGLFTLLASLAFAVWGVLYVSDEFEELAVDCETFELEPGCAEAAVARAPHTSASAKPLIMIFIVSDSIRNQATVPDRRRANCGGREIVFAFCRDFARGRIPAQIC